MSSRNYLKFMSEPISNNSVVLSDMELAGSLTFKGNLSFEGKLTKGSITGASLTVGKSAVIEGALLVDSLRVAGNVIGDITAKAKCDLSDSACVTGNLTSPRISLAEGATLMGQMQIGPVPAKIEPPKP